MATDLFVYGDESGLDIDVVIERGTSVILDETTASALNVSKDDQLRMASV